MNYFGSGEILVPVAIAGMTENQNNMFTIFEGHTGPSSRLILTACIFSFVNDAVCVITLVFYTQGCKNHFPTTKRKTNS